jgi:hypothetical protein
MTKKEKSILSDEDWELLLPSKAVTLGKSSISITPLCIEDFSKLTTKTVYVFNRVKELGEPTEIFRSATGFKKIVDIIVKEAPEIISLLTGIPIVDIKRLPVAKNLELMNVAWEVNTADQEALAKNLEGVAVMLNQISGGMLRNMMGTPDSEMPSSSLSEKGTDGEMSEDIPSGNSESSSEQSKDSNEKDTK